MRASTPDKLAGGGRIARHVHRLPYATVVLEGAYEEAGDAGRIAARAGDVLLHTAFAAHQDRIGARPAWVLDLPLPDDGREWPAVAKVADPELFVRLAGRDAREAAAGLIETLVEAGEQASDPADDLAAALRSASPPRISDWARHRGRSRESLTRRFGSLYGTSPAAYRLEALARHAWRRIVSTGDSLADIACDTGFADQPHMTRAVVRLTGHTPGEWRKRPAG
jgi:AraC-like DNA-binding protein